ncbi:hypothetical protein OKW76_07045 [Sphingomonas sp. S1-29]|uniref:hypothetical protein n=1 Tax=Sphingomonas sp. S1-29 TaxID=2991074 RepID=UPI00223F0B0C|nr:hypothetical protein [Sphingomonas sp. S1-29]UZK70771.1 hypothetical protein OKW76_07045 [Sphingomonas sp. S1-29]
MDRFQIDSIVPAYPNFWKAVVSFRTVEDVAGRSVAQVANLTVRLSFDENRPTIELLEAVYEAARHALALSSSYASENDHETAAKHENDVLEKQAKAWESPTFGT